MGELVDQSWWPYAAMIGGSAAVDTSGREMAKWRGLREHGLSLGTPAERRSVAGAMAVMLVIGVLAIATGLNEAT